MTDQDRYAADDARRQIAADELGDGFTRLAVMLAHVDRRRTNLEGRHEGDDMTPIDRMRFAFQGQPRAARYDGDSGSSPAYHVQTGDDDDGWRSLNSDPTGNAACRPDRAAQDLKALDKALRAALRDLEAATALVVQYGPARAATDAERAMVAKENYAAPRVCDSCGDLPLKVEASTVKGNLPTPAALCDWCYRWIGATGRKPTPNEAERHRRGDHPRVPDMNHTSRRGTAA